MSDVPCDAEGRPLRFWWWTSGLAEECDLSNATMWLDKALDRNPALRSPHGDMIVYWADQIKQYEDRNWRDD